MPWKEALPDIDALSGRARGQSDRAMLAAALIGAVLIVPGCLTPGLAFLDPPGFSQSYHRTHPEAGAYQSSIVEHSPHSHSAYTTSGYPSAGYSSAGYSTASGSGWTSWCSPRAWNNWIRRR